MYPQLYYAPPSFYSQIVRLALAEKLVTYDETIVIPGPPNYATYAPDYMRMNKNGTVPTLVIGDSVYDDSRKILEIIDDIGDGPVLIPADRSEMDTWMTRAYGLSERELAYGTGIAKTLGKQVNKHRAKALRRLATKNPDLADVYKAKLADIEGFARLAQTPSHVTALANRFDAEMDALNRHLANREYIAGDSYTLADLVWTVLIARQMLLKREPFKGRVNLAEWMGRMKMRPTYAYAEVWDHLSIGPLYKTISSLWAK